MSGNNENNGNQQPSGGNFGPGRFGMPGGGGRFGNGRNPELYWERAMMGYGGHRPIFPAGWEEGEEEHADKWEAREALACPVKAEAFLAVWVVEEASPVKWEVGCLGKAAECREEALACPVKAEGFLALWVVEDASTVKWEVAYQVKAVERREWEALACPAKAEDFLAVWVVEEASPVKWEVGCLGKEAECREWAAGKTSLPSFR
ncbi:hypothetical protein LTS10_009378 [Elasticomyces elasticus]|nr:hypothetical protein LTS10_009378 [Elasticomyces elasticus]